MGGVTAILPALEAAGNMPTRSSNTSSSSSSSSLTPQSRLSQVSRHVAPMAQQATNFTADVVPQAPEDPLFGLMAAFRKDESPDKVDLGIGAYRDDNAKPWILPVVKKVSARIPPWERATGQLCNC